MLVCRTLKSIVRIFNRFYQVYSWWETTQLMLWRVLFALNAWFMRERSSIITHYPAARGWGENLHPVYIITSSCPPTPTSALLFQHHDPGFEGMAKSPFREITLGLGLRVLPSCEIHKGILFLSSWKCQANEFPIMCVSVSWIQKHFRAGAKPPRCTLAPPWSAPPAASTLMTV